MTNKELYKKCLELSGMIKKYRNQFIALLPEVAKRKLYLEHGMHSIYEFAAKLACLSHDTVNRVLKISQKLEDKPILKSMFTSGEIGWSKLEVAVKLPETEKEIAKILPTISKEALVTLAKDSKSENTQSNFASEENHETTSQSTNKEIFSIKVNPNLLSQLRVLKLKLEKEQKQPLSWEQTLNIMVSKLQNPKPPKPRKQKGLKLKTTTSRYIPKATKQKILQKTNQFCAKCDKPAEHLHHQIPYSISKNHESIIPLCKAHHDLIHHSTSDHSINFKYQQHKKIALQTAVQR